MHRLESIHYILKNISNNDNKVKFGEVSTSFNLIKTMIDMIPEDFFKKKRKICEPCCGKGVILLYLLYKLEKYHSTEKALSMLYFFDINKENVLFTKKKLGGGNGYVGDSLLFNHKYKYDLTITNPPFNKPGCSNNGQSIYTQFIKKSIDITKRNGWVVLLTPLNWRSPGVKSNLMKLMSWDNWITEIKIYKKKDGMKEFKCSVAFDIYALRKGVKPKETKIKDWFDEYYINLFGVSFIPNYGLRKMIGYFDYKKRVLQKRKEKYEVGEYKLIKTITKSGPVFGSCNIKPTGEPKLLLSQNSNFYLDSKGLSYTKSIFEAPFYVHEFLLNNKLDFVMGAQWAIDVKFIDHLSPDFFKDVKKLY